MSVSSSASSLSSTPTVDTRLLPGHAYWIFLAVSPSTHPKGNCSLNPPASSSKIPCYEESLFYLSSKPHSGEYSLIIPPPTFFFSSNSLVTSFSRFHFAYIHNYVCSFLPVCHYYICLCPYLHISWLDHCSCLQLATQPFANFVQRSWIAWIWIPAPLHSGCVFGTGLAFLDCVISCYHLVYNSEYGSHRENWFGWI